MSARDFLARLPGLQDGGRRIGITSVCSAHPWVIEAALMEARETGQYACIEATCNQVNQDGGYTGMMPGDFAALVFDIADKVGLDRDRIVLGGDHLGPNPWRNRPSAEAMDKALVMARAYAAAGFAKIHADASMSCADDPAPLPVETIAERAAALVRAAEQGAAEGGHPAPVYVIGTEVPVPGGAAEKLEMLVTTPPEEAAETVSVHERVFADAGLAEALSRVVALVVQPGVEFGHSNVIRFVPDGAATLGAWRDGKGGLLFEAHSTDYQTAAGLAALVRGGFGILKVGPGLTFALREALYGLDQIAGMLVESYEPGRLKAAMERVMLADPGDWAAYYHGNEAPVLRHFSYSDRIRYYWARPEAQLAVGTLMDALAGRPIPETLLSQYLPRLYDAVVADTLEPDAEALVLAHIRLALAPYSAACAGGV